MDEVFDAVHNSDKLSGYFTTGGGQRSPLEHRLGSDLMLDRSGSRRAARVSAPLRPRDRLRRIDRMDVTLRETTLEDVPILFEHQRDPVAAEVAAFPSRDRDAFVAHDAKVRADPTAIRRTILAGGEVVGWIGVWGEDEREIGYWIDRTAWGKGIATAALAALLTEVQERPLTAHVAEHNVGSMRVLERNGFVETGREQEEDVVMVGFRLD